MPDNTPITIRPMRLNDIGNCLLLSGAEGWNQTENDWKRLAGSPKNICLVAESVDRIIGTATAMNYANEIAWIGMVLVDKAHRGRGISRLLLTDLLDHLASCRSVKLDATPAGQPVYEKFGFKDEYTIYRMTHLSPDRDPTAISGNAPEPVQLSELPEIIALDHAIFGANRISLLTSLVKENRGNTWLIKNHGKITGFALGRQGNKYYQIGPVFASGLTDARSLISMAVAGLHKKPVVVDVQADKEDLILWLNSIGFTSQRHFVRMYLKINPLPGIPRNQFLICGPEFG